MDGIRVKCVYEPVADDDGIRVLVEREWPPRLTKEQASVDVWLTDLAPSRALRDRLEADPECWSEFRRAYRAELRGQHGMLVALRAAVRAGPVTLLSASSHGTRNGAMALAEMVAGASPPPDRSSF